MEHEDWIHGRELERAALEAVAAVQDSGRYDGKAPSHALPKSIPTQRFNGLARRGYLRFAWGAWELTPKGCDYIDELRVPG